MTAYRTVVTELPATPLGLLPARWSIDHRCTTCHRTVPTDQLIAHACDHRDGATHDTSEATPAIPEQSATWGKPTRKVGEFPRAAARLPHRRSDPSAEAGT